MTLTLALSKGRLLTGARALFTGAGLAFPAEDTRRLIVDAGDLRFLFVKDMDVPVYVEYGVADVGICGSDVLLEGKNDVLVPLDLGYGRCRMVLAAPSSSGWGGAWPTTLHVATKYERIARSFIEARGLACEIVKLHGSVEIAPGLGLADCIVDMVETGRTLQENGLVVVEEIVATSARLIVNRASDHLKRGEVAELLEKLKAKIDRRDRNAD